MVKKNGFKYLVTVKDTPPTDYMNEGYALLAKRLPQFNHPVKFSFDSPLTVLVGGNGSGKSTIMKAIGGVSENYSHLVYNELDLDDSFYVLSCQRRSCRQSRGIDPKKNQFVYDGKPPIYADSYRYFDLTGRFDPGLLQYVFHTKSTGQAQLFIIKNLQNEDVIGRIPPSYLLDEVGTTMDPVNSKEITERLNSLANEKQIIIGTHNPNIVRNLRSDSILYSLDEVSDGKPVMHKLSDMNLQDVEKLMYGGR